METGRALVLYTASSSKKDKEALTSVLAALRSQKMAAGAVERRKLSASHFRGAGVCVAVGGHGEAAAHRPQKIPGRQGRDKGAAHPRMRGHWEEAPGLRRQRVLRRSVEILPHLPL